MHFKHVLCIHKFRDLMQEEYTMLTLFELSCVLRQNDIFVDSKRGLLRVGKRELNVDEPHAVGHFVCKWISESFMLLPYADQQYLASKTDNFSALFDFVFKHEQGFQYELEMEDKEEEKNTEGEENSLEEEEESNDGLSEEGLLKDLIKEASS